MKQKMKFIFIYLIAIANSHCEKDVHIFNPPQSCGNDLVISDSLYNKALLPDSIYCQCIDNTQDSCWSKIDHFIGYNYYVAFLNPSNPAHPDTVKDIKIYGDCLSIPIEHISASSMSLIWNGKIEQQGSEYVAKILVYEDKILCESMMILEGGIYDYNLLPIHNNIEQNIRGIKYIKIILNPHISDWRRREIIYWL